MYNDLISRSLYRHKLNLILNTLSDGLLKAYKEDNQEYITMCKNYISAYNIALQILNDLPDAHGSETNGGLSRYEQKFIYYGDT